MPFDLENNMKSKLIYLQICLYIFDLIYNSKKQ
jgi:hypothetical protein